MSSPVYVNDEPVPMTIGDINNPMSIQIGNAGCPPVPTDYSSYPRMAVTAVLTLRGDASTAFAVVFCSVIDATIGLFLFPGFPKGTLAYNSTTNVGTPPGSYDLSFNLDYYGDGVTRVSSVDGMLAVRLHEARPYT